MGSVIDGPPTTRRWFLTQERFFRVLSSVVKVSRWEEGTSGRNLKRTRLLVEILEGKVQGSRRFGSLGNRDALLMLFSFKNSISTRSRPSDEKNQ